MILQTRTRLRIYSNVQSCVIWEAESSAHFASLFILVFPHLCFHYSDLCVTSVCVVSILRLQSLVAISNSADPTYDNPPAATWSSVEINVGIICSCLPCLRPLLARFMPNVFSTSIQCSANSAPTPNRSKYSRRLSDLDISLATINPKYTQGSSIEEKEEGRIQVVTVVDVSVEDLLEHQAMSDWEATERKCDSSTKNLIGDVEKAEDMPEL